VVEGLAAAFGLANIAGVVLSWPILSHRLHGLAGRQIAGSLVRMHLAALPCLFFALAASLMVSVLLSPGPAYGIATLIIGGGGALLLYLVFARALGITELTELTSGLRTRLRR
jgi:putative peptidoglycan lipid II flippase